MTLCCVPQVLDQEERDVPAAGSETETERRKDENGSWGAAVQYSLVEHTQHRLTEQHCDNEIWALKLERRATTNLTAGWENFGKEKVVDNWEDRSDTVNEPVAEAEARPGES